jgi:hypothetical protein
MTSKTTILGQAYGTKLGATRNIFEEHMGNNKKSKKSNTSLLLKII